jgi:hypothetical protein
VAFLLQKLGRVLVGGSRWLRLGCGWLHLVQVVDVLPGVLRNPVVIGVNGDLDAMVSSLSAHFRQVVTQGEPGRDPGMP